MNAKLKLISVITISATFSACSLIPEYMHPDPGVTLNPDTETQQPLASEIEWRDFYRDSQLQQLIALSLENNRDLRTASLQVEQQRARYRIERSALLPSIDANASFSRRRNPDSTSSTQFGGGILEDYRVGVGMTSWEIDFFGRINSLQEAALQRYLASAAASKSLQLSLIAEVANAYFSWQATTAQAELSRSIRIGREEGFELVERRFNNGLSSELALRQAETVLHEARVAEARFIQEANQNFTTLQLLVGITLDKSHWQHSWVDLATMNDLPVNLTSDVLLNRPDVIQAEYEIRAANADIGVARAAFFPRISLTSSIGLAANQPSYLSQTSSRTWEISPQFQLPLIDWGLNQANLDVAELQKDINISRYQSVVQRAFREVFDEMEARMTLDDQLDAQSDLSAAAERSLVLAQVRFDAGIDSYLEVLDAQRSHFDTQLTRIDIQLARLRNQLTLYKALGGG